MTVNGPDFDELVGGDDLGDTERERLRRVHELLVMAGPPPDFEPAVPPAPPEASVTRLDTRRASKRRLAVVAVAAVFLVVAFGAGYMTGNRGGAAPVNVVAMTGTGAATRASASLAVYQVGPGGNWPMKLTVAHLRPAAGGNPYELWLTKGGKLAELCASFRPKADGSVVVPMNVPYKLADYDGWVVVEEGSNTPLLTTA